MEIPLEKIVLLAALAGEVLLKNGGETRRVEETMEHMARACGAAGVESFVIPTGVFLTVSDASGQSLTMIRRVRDRTINLDRIAKVNELSRRLVERRIDPGSAKAILLRISQERSGFSLPTSIAASGAIGATTAVLQAGGFFEIGAAFVAAGAVRYIAHVVSRLQGTPVAYEFLGGAVVAVIGSVLYYYWPQLGRDSIIIGGIMPLVPGMAITNALRDFIVGDLVSGLSRGMEALLTAVAVAMGVFIVLATVL
ncbi:threonine/serine exporter family protein [Propionispora hippei]|uniref:Uncharacterized membrane protein YjjP, DUF1212 family n=1 Tax=Propionispora hippei DSM 15287 TaxID=1123003 RepID=A0A1M6JN79_9FIRM|nr:threonine/serine exporter family protein [Propionispora hippei]SHJ48177.1 Uncharacterized membrane protein YjjP, DUF1212 family [Propionispora hippei DSM 15287]